MLTDSDIEWLLDDPEKRCPLLAKAVNAEDVNVKATLRSALREINLSLSQLSDYDKDRAPVYIFDGE